MKNIRLKYHRDTGIRIQPEINLIEDYIYKNGNGDFIRPFPNLFDYINWLEDQIDKPVGIRAVNTAEAAEKLRIGLLKL